MKQAVTVGPRQVVMSDGPEARAPGPGEALLAIEAVGICGSDLHVFVGDDPYTHYPIRQGHEFSGRVEALGPDAGSRVRIGQRVAVQPTLACGQCIACRRGRSNACVELQVFGAHVDGALVERLIVPVANLYPADDLAADLAAFVEPVSIGLQMVGRSGLAEGDQALLLGAGPIGQSVLLVARGRGARFLVADRVTARLDVARSLGAEAMVDTTTHDLVAALDAWTDGDGPLVIFEATGASAMVRRAVELVAATGTVVVAGTPDDDVNFPAIALVKKELALLGSRNNAGTFTDAVDLVRREAALVQPLITHHFPLADVGAAMELAIRDPGSVGKVIIEVG